MATPDKINCIIIEDEPAASRILETFISRVAMLRLQDTFNSVEKALPFINTNTPDLIFLDINLPGISGVQFAQSGALSCGIIFTTAYTEYAVESFELDVVDYLLKPISFERFSKAVNRYLKYYGKNIAPLEAVSGMPGKPFIMVKADRRNVKILLEDIIYLEAQRNSLLIHTEKETHRIYQSISDMEEKLPEVLFVRTHRSFIVSVGKITGYSVAYVMAGKHKIPVGRMYSEMVKKLYTAGDR